MTTDITKLEPDELVEYFRAHLDMAVKVAFGRKILEQACDDFHAPPDVREQLLNKYDDEHREPIAE